MNPVFVNLWLFFRLFGPLVVNKFFVNIVLHWKYSKIIWLEGWIHTRLFAFQPLRIRCIVQILVGHKESLWQILVQSATLCLRPLSKPLVIGTAAHV